MTDIKLGSEVKDKVTGFKGIVIGIAVYLFGCKQYGVACKSSTKRETEWFDEGRIVLIGKGIAPKEVRAKKDGAEFNTDAPRG